MLARIFEIIFSILPPAATRWFLQKFSDEAEMDYRLTDMRTVKGDGAFAYSGVELLHRDSGFASFVATDHETEVRWAVTFEAIRDFDPEWGEIVEAMRRASDALITKANEIYSAGAFEPDGSIVVRNLRA